jgi:hypothetical protein
MALNGQAGIGSWNWLAAQNGVHPRNSGAPFSESARKGYFL